MPNQVQILKIVVASPSDVQVERDRLPNVIDELNRSTALDRGIRLEIVRWETDAFPAFHADGPQGLIDGILKIENCDVFIGIFWKRFGTPVKDAASGTEHEFNTAYEAWRQNGQPQIMLYFKQKSYTPKSKEETDQWGQVLQFKNNVPAEGLWWTYKNITEFETLIRRHLIQFLRNLVPQSFQLSTDLSINILGTKMYDYSRAITLDFCIINDSQKHKTLIDLSIEILSAEPVLDYSIKSLGALFSPIKYSVNLDPLRVRIPITEQRFMYKPNERDDFQLQLWSEPGWEYKIRISALNKDILRNHTSQLISEAVLLKYPRSI